MARTGRQRLAAAVSEWLLEVHAQPIVQLTGGRVAGIEALLHLPDPGARIASASASRADLAASRELLAQVGQLPELVEVNDWYLERAGEALDLWQLQCPADAGEPLFLSVKLDSRFISQSAFLPTVKDAVRRAGLSPSRILLTVDASEPLEQLWPQLQRLKSHGVRVALEDFSADPAITDLVARFPFDVVRLSAATVACGAGPQSSRGSDVDGPGSSLAGLVKLAHHLGCAVIGEGVDQMYQAECLLRAGCDLAIGGFVSLTPPDA